MGQREAQVDECETDSDEEETENEKGPELVKRACITRSGRSCVCAPLLVTVSSN